MATREELAQALRNADAMGDTSAARRLAAALSNYTDENNVPAPTAPPPPANGVDVFSKMPLWQKALTPVADAGRLIGSGVTLGGYDKLAGAVAPYIGGSDAAGQRALTQQARDRGGMGGSMLELSSSLIPAAATEGATALPAVSNGFMRALAALGIGGLEGAGYGGIQASNEDRSVPEGMATGAGFGVAGQAAAGLLSKAGGKIGELFSGKPARLSPDNLEAAKDAAYKAAEDVGVQYTPSTIRGMLSQMDAAAQPYPGRHNEVIATRKQIGKNLDGRPASLSEVDTNRQIINKDLGSLQDPRSRDMGYDYSHAIDDYLKQVDQSGVTARSGDPAEGLAHIEKARELNSRLEKMKALNEVDYKAELQANKSISQGKDTTLKNNVTGILTNPKKRRGYTPDEIAQMEEVVNGTTASNLGRQVGRLAPGGGMSFVGAGAGANIMGLLTGWNPALMSIGGGIPLAAGMAGKKIAERSTEKSAQKLYDLVAAGGKNVPKASGMSSQDRDNLGRILMMMQLNQTRQ